MKQKTRNLTLAIRLAATVFTTFSLIATSSAADVSWDLFGGGPSDSAITGGTGFWDGSTTNWTSDAGASNVLWNNANNDVAIFGDVAGVVTITVPVTAGGIVFNASGYSISGNVITLGGATTNITVASALTASISSEIAGGVLNVGTATAGTGTLALSGINSHTGLTNVNFGTLDIQNASAFGSNAIGTTVANGAGLSISGDITVAGEILTIRGAGVGNVGALRNLSGNNSWTGAITLSNSLRVTSDSGTLTLGDIDTQPAAAARTFIMNGAGNVIVNGVVGGTGSGAGGIVSVDNLNNVATPGTLTLNGADTYAGNTTLTGGGTLTLAGARTVASGNIIVTNGILNISGTRTGGSGTITVGDGNGFTGTLNLTNGDFAAASIVVGSTPAAATSGSPGIGVVNHSAGVLSTPGQILMGTFNTSSTIGVGTGTYNLSGGSLKSSNTSLAALCIGTQTGGIATFNLSGTGLLEMTGIGGILQIGRSSSTTTLSNGTFNQTGGTATLLNLAMGNANNSNTTSVLNLSNGTFSVATAFTAMAAGANSSASISISGDAIVTLPAFPTVRGLNSTAVITFDGGTLKPAGASSSYMSGLTDGTPEAVGATIQDGGVTIEVATGNDIVIAQDLDTHPVSLGGGLAKTGAGVLGLSGVNTYTGPTNVPDGTLALLGGSQASPIQVDDGAFLQFDVGTPSPPTSSSSVTFAANARVRIVGTPTLASYTLMTASSFSPDPLLETPIAGYQLVVDGNELKLNSTGATGYSTWAAAFTAPALSDTAATADPDNDGLDNLVEYALGLDPRFSSPSPGIVSNGGKTITFTKGAEAKVNLDVTYKIEISISLGAAPTPWTDATAPDVTETTDTIALTFPNGPAINFARLKITQP